MNKTRRGTRTGGLAPTSVGGDIARRGFRFQDLWILVNLTEWLNEASFHGFRNEGADDVEVWWSGAGARQKEIHRYQLKDTIVGKSLMCSVVKDFHRAYVDYPGQWGHYYLVSSRCTQEVESLVRAFLRLRQDADSYGRSSKYFKDTCSEVMRLLKNAECDIDDIEFVLDRVTLKLDESFVKDQKRAISYASAMLLNLGVARDLANEACAALSLLISHDVGNFIEKGVVLDKINHYRVTPLSRAGIKVVATQIKSQLVKPEEQSLRLSQADDHRSVRRNIAACRIMIIPGGAVIIETPGNQFGLIDCGMRAARATATYLAYRSVRRLAFIAVSHWHSDHYGGFPAILSMIDQVENVLLPDPGLLTAGRAINNSPSPFMECLRDLEVRAKAGETMLFNISGGVHTYEIDESRDLGPRVLLQSFGPWPGALASKHYHVSQNDYCVVFKISVGEHSFLMPGDAGRRAWEQFMRQADKSRPGQKVDGLILPHHGSRRSMWEDLLKDLVKDDGFIAVVEPNRIYGLPHGDVLDLVRRTGGTIQVCDSEPVTVMLDATGVQLA